ncbi:hypothetical protein TOPH_01789 [Tolypocladium ophioglossoides CBS 100239]|uniref:F-box domain-containing protein n=1 Tax=Tolypocladium ophioglossoides (strain CBS 100239) TaxID=1163406 RepID=A0A0L0NHL2_TOLOC|nr:hypothetical protein TOPH_01789 [Tolypocladium ophioglossoides CBS 100239]
MSSPMKESTTGEIADHGQDSRMDDDTAAILAFPREVLIMIIKLAVLDPNAKLVVDPFATPYSSEAGKTIALTCRLLYRLVLPFLYHSFLLDYPGGKLTRSWKMRYLDRTIANNPSLGQYCRNLSIYIADANPQLDEERYVEWLPRWLSGVRNLKVRGDPYGMPDIRAWSFMRHCSKHMSGIETLSLGGWRALYQQQIFDHVYMPSLRSLHLYAVREDPDQGPSLHPDRYGSARFTKLVLLAYGESTPALEELLKWPRKLDLFYLSYYFHPKNNIKLPMMSTLLRSHKDTLRVISVSHLTLGGGRVPDLSGFPVLESLSICRCDMTKSLEWPTDDAHRLLAPRLRVFQWNFRLPHAEHPLLTDFGDKEEHWLRVFSEVAMATRAALKTIKVIFEPLKWEYVDGDESPWDRMNKIRNDVAKHGLRITYSTIPECEEKLTPEEMLEQQVAASW